MGDGEGATGSASPPPAAAAPAQAASGRRGGARCCAHGLAEADFTGAMAQAWCQQRRIGAGVASGAGAVAAGARARRPAQARGRGQAVGRHDLLGRWRTGHRHRYTRPPRPPSGRQPGRPILGVLLGSRSSGLTVWKSPSPPPLPALGVENDRVVVGRMISRRDMMSS